MGSHILCAKVIIVAENYITSPHGVVIVNKLWLSLVRIDHSVLDSTLSELVVTLDWMGDMMNLLNRGVLNLRLYLNSGLRTHKVGLACRHCDGLTWRWQ